MSAPEHDVRYAYDDLGRLSAVSAVLFHGQTLSSPSVTRYTYDRAGRTDLVTLPNGLTTDHDYDPLGRLVSLSVTRDDLSTEAAERTPVASFGYELLGDGRRREVTERRFTPAGTLFSGTRVTYAFDRQGRLTEEDHLTTSAATGSALLAFRDGYTYDPAGNRLSKAHDADRNGHTSDPGDHTVTYDYDDHDDRLLTETRTPGSGGAPVTTAYFHDAAGNTTRVESGGTVTRYGYDLRGRQTETHRDADDIPEATTARDSRGGVVAETAGGVTTTHLLDYHNPTGYSQVLEQRTGSELTRSFVLGPSVLAQADGQGGGGTAYLGRDAHSGVRFTTDAAGLMAEQYTYDAFGVPQGFDPATARSVHLFHGERFSPALGGSDVRGERVYEAGTGRWRTADRYTPGVGDLSDRNRYAFVGADPVNYRDPSGKYGVGELLTVVAIGGLTSGLVSGLTNVVVGGGGFIEGFARGWIAGSLSTALMIWGVPPPWAMAAGNLAGDIVIDYWMGNYDSRDPGRVAITIAKTVMNAGAGFLGGKVVSEVFPAADAVNPATFYAHLVQFEGGAYVKSALEELTLLLAVGSAQGFAPSLVGSVADKIYDLVQGLSRLRPGAPRV